MCEPENAYFRALTTERKFPLTLGVRCRWHLVLATRSYAEGDHFKVRILVPLH